MYKNTACREAPWRFREGKREAILQTSLHKESVGRLGSTRSHCTLTAWADLAPQGHFAYFLFVHQRGPQASPAQRAYPGPPKEPQKPTCNYVKQIGSNREAHSPFLAICVPRVILTIFGQLIKGPNWERGPPPKTCVSRNTFPDIQKHVSV